MKLIATTLAAILLTILFAGCASSTGSYTSRATNVDVGNYIGELAEKNQAYEGIKRIPVIIIPGFQGSMLKNTKTGENVWGEFKTIDILTGNNRKLRELCFPMEKGKRVTELNDGVVPDGILKNVKVRIMGITVEAPAYKSLVETLLFGGYQPEFLPLAKGKHFNSLFEFAYDWRKDLAYNARMFDKFVKEKKKYLQKKYEELYGIKDFDVQFDIIAHSMGGLLARYYLRYGGADLPEDGTVPKITWAGCKHINALVIAGTPNAGYLDTFLELLEGAKTLNYSPASLGTLPTYYQMLPAPSTKSILYYGSNEPVDVFNPKLWEKMKWGLMDPKEDETLQILLPKVKTKEERRSIAFDHLSKCLARAKQFIETMKVKASPPNDVTLHLIFGYGIKTSRRIYIDPKTGKVKKTEYAPGDGKVLGTSALWDERAGGKWTVFMRSPIDWSSMTLLRAAHMGILEAPSFQDNVLFHLAMTETEKQKKILEEIKIK